MFILKFFPAAFLLLLALYAWYKDILISRSRIKAVGKISAIERKVINVDDNGDIWGYEMAVTFMIRDDQPIVTSYTNVETNFYYIGMEVNVLYAKDDPENCIINGEYQSKGNHGIAIFLFLVTGLFLLLGALIIPI